MNTEEKIRQYIADGCEVTVIYSTELHEPCWAVQVDDSEDFWLNSFPTKDEAIEYCMKNLLPHSVENGHLTELGPNAMVQHRKNSDLLARLAFAEAVCEAVRVGKYPKDAATDAAMLRWMVEKM